MEGTWGSRSGWITAAAQCAGGSSGFSGATLLSIFTFSLYLVLFTQTGTSSTAVYYWPVNAGTLVWAYITVQCSLSSLFMSVTTSQLSSHFSSFFLPVPPFSHLSSPRRCILLLFSFHLPDPLRLFSFHSRSCHSHLPCNHLIPITYSRPLRPFPHLHLIPSLATHYILAQTHCSSAWLLKSPCASCCFFLLSETCYWPVFGIKGDGKSWLFILFC